MFLFDQLVVFPGQPNSSTLLLKLLFVKREFMRKNSKAKNMKAYVTNILIKDEISFVPYKDSVRLIKK
jgi:hypothetical protein